MQIDYEKYFKKLLALNEVGIYVHPADGHYWIEHDRERDEYRCPVEALKNAGISLNNKIYGGYIEAIETVWKALEMAGYKLSETFDKYDLCPAVAAMDRISGTTAGLGGLY
jgi:hypothetical protein